MYYYLSFVKATDVNYSFQSNMCVHEFVLTITTCCTPQDVSTYT